MLGLQFRDSLLIEWTELSLLFLQAGSDIGAVPECGTDQCDLT